MIRMGILGAAKIAPGAVIRPASKLDEIEIVAVAASSADRAAAFAELHHIPASFGSYRQLVEADGVDVVYNALPPSMHESWSIAALETGKHVLCEKPFALNGDQAARMAAAARHYGRNLIEAFHHRFHPLFQRVIALMDAGTVGELRHITARFDVYIPYRDGELRHSVELGGGALMDLGCYPVHWVRTIAGAEPTVTRATGVFGPSGVDLTMSAGLRFPGGVTADISTAMDESAGTEHVARIEIEGSLGLIVVDNPLHPERGNRIVIDTESSHGEETVPGESTYYYQLQHFVAVIGGDARPVTGGNDAINNMRLIDAIYCAAGMSPRGSD